MILPLACAAVYLPQAVSPQPQSARRNGLDARTNASPLFEVNFAAGLGAATSIVESVGACGLGNAAWTPTTTPSGWQVQAYASGPDSDPGFSHVELSLLPPLPSIGVDFGLALLWQRGGFAVSLPRTEGADPQLDDLATWETIRYSPLPELQQLAGIIVDGRPIHGAE